MRIDDFSRQLDYFGNEFGFVTKDELKESLETGVPAKGVILTFDDGFKDHFDYVLPELESRGLWGIFYIPMAPYINGRILDVHRIHLLLGKYAGDVVQEALNEMLDEEMLSHAHIDEFHSKTYKRQLGNTESVSYVKRVLNYFIDYRYRGMLIDKLMLHFFDKDMYSLFDVYMTENELKLMNQRGMILGSHTVNHPVMSKISESAQEVEIIESFNKLEAIVGDVRIKTFCYPYGGFHSFTKSTEEVLLKGGVEFSFNVEPRDIDKVDLSIGKQSLPRFDCNQFP